MDKKLVDRADVMVWKLKRGRVSPGSTKAEGIDQNLLMVGDSCLDRPAFTMGKSPFHSCASAMEGMVGFYLRHWTHFGASYQAPLRC